MTASREQQLNPAVTNVQKIGVMGGSFDPVHLGHVNLARDALSQARLDRVLMVPARLQPFKQDRTPASGEDRMEMLRLALKDDPQIEPCAYELEHEGVSYTFLTLRGIQEQYGPHAKLYFIIGTDSLLKLDTWMNAEELLTKYSYIVGSRPGYLDQELKVHRQMLQKRYGTEILLIHNRQFDVSATELRHMIAMGQDLPKALVPAPVTDYIREHGLYRSEIDQKKIMETLDERGLEYIRANLKPSRYNHTMRVREEAVRLANRFGADPAKADTAAIFHDMAKNLPTEEMNRLILEFGLEKRYLNNANLAHSKLAACLMRRDFGITDSELLNAVASHTTGRAGMGLLEKVIFLADAIEPGRDYPAVKEIRKLAENDLDMACIRMLERTIEYLTKIGTEIDPDTQAALDDLLLKNNIPKGRRITE